MTIEKGGLHVYQKYQEKKNLYNVVEKEKQNRMEVMQSQQKSILQVDNTLLNTSGVLAYFTRYFKEQNVQVKTIQMLNVKTVGQVSVLPVKINAEGQFSEFINWIVSLAQCSRVIVINDFSFQRDEYGIVTADIQLFILGLHTISETHLAQPVSVKQMKWGGIFLGKNTQLGFLILPNGKVLEVKVGEMIGMEKGIVIAIEENEIRIRIANQMLKIKPAYS